MNPDTLTIDQTFETLRAECETLGELALKLEYQAIDQSTYEVAHRQAHRRRELLHEDLRRAGVTQDNITAMERAWHDEWVQVL